MEVYCGVLTGLMLVKLDKVRTSAASKLEPICVPFVFDLILVHVA